MKDYTLFSCPNDKCKMHEQTGQNNIAHHSWMGKYKNIERLRCRCCGQKFSENRDSLRERAKLSEATQVQMLKCFRWGVPDAGIAEICEVNEKSVQLFRKKASKLAQLHHERAVQKVQATGIQVDEIRVQQGKSITWAAVAIVMQTYLILAMTWGKRDQSLADCLLAEIWGRCSQLTLLLSDGWKSYYSALMRCFGRLYRPRRQSGGRLLAHLIKIDTRALFYGQVIKQTRDRFYLCAVKCRAKLGSLRECCLFIRAYGLGKKIHTSHIERWFGTLRCCVASLRRKSRCYGKNPTIMGEKIWLHILFHNWVIPHASLSQGETPAMAADLMKVPLTYKQLIRMNCRGCKEIRDKIKDQVKRMGSPEVHKAYRRSRHPKGEEEVIWREPSKELQVAA